MISSNDARPDVQPTNRRGNGNGRAAAALPLGNLVAERKGAPSGPANAGLLSQPGPAGQAAERIAEQIRQGAWQIGDQLPPERDLCLQLGVGRTSVRDALRILAAQGVVATRAGQGTFVAAAKAARTPSPYADWNRRHDYTIEDVVDMRRLLEGRAAELAVHHATTTDLARLRAAIDNLAAACKRNDLSGMVDADTCFHEAFTHAAGNRLLARLMHTIMGLLVESRRISLGVPGRGTHVLTRHREILAAIEARDLQRAVTAVHAHVDDLRGLGVRPLAIQEL
ncbi:MAG TPA: FadR/GntR family transcriptional regulator [Chloroflexota bacterium]|nr:FadR/GntR family transcriptional regulator [Chloroflexota bacterium]